jgi:hypothetical protein
LSVTITFWCFPFFYFLFKKTPLGFFSSNKKKTFSVFSYLIKTLFLTSITKKFLFPVKIALRKSFERKE